MWESNDFFGFSTVFFILIIMIITIVFLAYTSMIQSWKWFLEFHDHLLNCFCFSSFYYDICYYPFFKMPENQDLSFIIK